MDRVSALRMQQATMEAGRELAQARPFARLNADLSEVEADVYFGTVSVVEDLGAGGQQRYTVALVSGLNKETVGVTVEHCQVADDSADTLEVGDAVTVIIKKSGEGMIVSGVGGSGGGGVDVDVSGYYWGLYWGLNV